MTIKGSGGKVIKFTDAGAALEEAEFLVGSTGQSHSVVPYGDTRYKVIRKAVALQNNYTIYESVVA